MIFFLSNKYIRLLIRNFVPKKRTIVKKFNIIFQKFRKNSLSINKIIIKQLSEFVNDKVKISTETFEISRYLLNVFTIVFFFLRINYLYIYTSGGWWLFNQGMLSKKVASFFEILYRKIISLLSINHSNFLSGIFFFFFLFKLWYSRRLEYIPIWRWDETERHLILYHLSPNYCKIIRFTTRW